MSVERLDTENCGDPLQAFLHKQRYDFVLSQLRTDDSVLEIGTGVGALARMLLGHCASYVGIEYDSDSCAEACRRTNNANIIQADARTLPFRDDNFSFIICLEVLEHLGDWKAGVRHIHRCLQKNGVAIISVPYRRRGGRSKTNEYHIYEPGERQLVEELNRFFDRVEIEYQFFQESFFMSLARTLRVRRFVGLAKLYSDLSRGEPYTLDRLILSDRPKGLKIGLVIVATGKK
jgi:ubiquinone/menaquinone biosynthesis C-methylase UbiE